MVGTRGRVAIALVSVLLVAFLVVTSQQAAIGSALFERAVRERVGRDATAGLPDGLHVALCGTGSPLPSPGRAGPCTVVIAGNQIFVVNIGEGGGRNISLMGLPLGRIAGVFLTHFHSDHIDGLGPMMLLRWAGSSNTSPLPVHGPSGVEAIVDGCKTAYIADNGYRTAHHGDAIVPSAAERGLGF